MANEYQSQMEALLAAVEGRRRRKNGLWRGIVFGNLAGAVMIGLNILILTHSASDIYIASDFTLVPLVMGIVGEFYWRAALPHTWERFGLAAATAGVACGLAAIFLWEGIICLMIAAPLLILVIWLGALLGAWLFAKADRRLQVSLIPLLVLLMIGDSLAPHHYANAVTDTVTIRATPAQIWPYIAGYPPITQPPDYWLWRIGLPCPIQSTATGEFVGAERRCVFTRGVVFGERITVCRPGQNLTFVITRQPRNPEILHHLVLHQGQFLLRDNGNGTTTVIGTSWYNLNVYPAAYFDLWTRDIIRHVHQRVFGQIKTLAETSVTKRRRIMPISAEYTPNSEAWHGRSERGIGYGTGYRRGGGAGAARFGSGAAGAAAAGGAAGGARVGRRHGQRAARRAALAGGGGDIGAT